MSEPSKLMLGSAQFGLNYGISNQLGQTSQIQVREILELGLSAGLNFIDTARSYGESERVLGESRDLLSDYQVVTKLAYLQREKITPTTSFRESLQRLGLKQTYGLLFHDVGDLLGPNGNAYLSEVLEIKKCGQIRKFGVSVYSLNQLKEVLRKTEIDLVQLPLNILDRRFLEDDFLTELKKRGIEIHVRSVFLQGLLLMDPHRLPDFFSPLGSHLQNLRRSVTGKGYSALEVCLAFVKNIPQVDRIVIGINEVAQLREILNAYQREVSFDARGYALLDEKFLLPTNWKI
jgi:aryl-alcohol dehydrogenase-like predicted oxidoreductase